ncbi:MAG: prolipoprotein diacylglyceryl transferase [Actinomycetota bacterium]|nr:prolipoprotein diacylglyceryl transferase [Actinomycetota bacterium]
MTYPSIDPVLLRLGPVHVHWYGLAYVVGFIAAALLFRRLSRQWGVGLTDDDVLNALLYCVIGVLLGGRLGYVLFYGGRHYLDDPVRVFAIWDGGMAFHGGLAGIIIAGVLFARRVGVPFLRLADMAAVGAPVGFFFGRLANFINGELWGRVTDVSWAMVFPGAGASPRHPSQLYEAVLEGLVMFVVLSVMARRRRPTGAIFGWMLLMYGSFRLLVEFVREPDAQLGLVLGPLTMGQLLSAPLVVLGVWFIWRALRAEDTRGAAVPGKPAKTSGSD